MAIIKLMAATGLALELASFILAVTGCGMLAIVTGILGALFAGIGIGLLFFFWLVRMITRIVKDEWLK